MANTPSTSFRFSPELLRDLDRYAARLARQSGVPVTRTAAAAKLIAAGVASSAEGKAAPRPARPRDRQRARK
jgi:hypothetical protein